MKLKLKLKSNSFYFIHLPKTIKKEFFVKTTLISFSIRAYNILT